MGVIYNQNAKETELYSAYGYTVSGKINRYIWTYDGSGREENCYTSIKITDPEDNIILAREMGNNTIFEGTFNSHIDNFLWWIKNDSPSDYEIEKMLLVVLVKNDGLFSYKINNRKIDQRRKEAEQKEREETEKKLKAYCEELETYCKNKGFIFYRSWDGVYIFRINYDIDHVKEVLKKENSNLMEHYIKYAEQFPERELTIAFHGNIVDAMDFIK